MSKSPTTTTTTSLQSPPTSASTPNLTVVPSSTAKPSSPAKSAPSTKSSSPAMATPSPVSPQAQEKPRPRYGYRKILSAEKSNNSQYFFQREIQPFELSTTAASWRSQASDHGGFHLQWRQVQLNAIIISIILSIDQRSELEGRTKDVKFSLIFCMLKSSHQDQLVIMGFYSKGLLSLQQPQIRA